MQFKNDEAMKRLKTTAVPASGAFGDVLAQIQDVTRQAAANQMKVKDKLTNTGITLMAACAIVSIAVSIVLCIVFASLTARQLGAPLPTAGGQSVGFVRLVGGSAGQAGDG